MSMAQRERRALVAAMAAAGADAPTLCAGWDVRDLAAHLVIRERRPDIVPGIVLKPLAGYVEAVQARTAGRPFTELLELIRTGPPWYWPMRPLDAIANLSEMFVHHEDVRRAQPGWEPRELSDEDEAALWRLLRRTARLNYRKSPVTVVLATPGGERVTAHRSGAAEVVLTGPPSELMLHAFGRNEVRIDAQGAPADVQAVLGSDRRF
ncbi:TIGR03085 family metal-binding protein [Nocardia terpenica]|uniref:TIGR03085 family protein n=1 Tax=Nocardia terpenica TaxID=455432 RepID=A0A291RP98_9NOCA|nr:TIGR03085 family metal-binding protein [Nocardia terpenica]ATL69014.1 TIGR03085 family protein [Nocardia terpenica]